MFQFSFICSIVAGLSNNFEDKWSVILVLDLLVAFLSFAPDVNLIRLCLCCVYSVYEYLSLNAI